MVGNPPIKPTEESEADNCADPPDLTTDNPSADTDNTGYDETRHSPEIWIEDSLIHNTELDNFIQAAVELVQEDSPSNKMKTLVPVVSGGVCGRDKNATWDKKPSILRRHSDLLRGSDRQKPHLYGRHDATLREGGRRQQVVPKSSGRSDKTKSELMQSGRMEKLRRNLATRPTKRHNNMCTFPKE